MFLWDVRNSVGASASHMSFCEMQFNHLFLKIQIFPVMVWRKEFWINVLVLNLFTVLLTLDGPSDTSGLPLPYW